MRERYKTASAVMLFLVREQNGKREILLQKRQNTGYADGMWDCGAAGHVEMGETMRMAMIREAAEELGVTLSPADVWFATLTHKTSPDGTAYVNIFFCAECGEAEPRICEPEKCAELRWFSLDALPENLLEDRRAALENFRRGIPYSEFGWKELEHA